MAYLTVRRVACLPNAPARADLPPRQRWDHLGTGLRRPSQGRAAAESAGDVRAAVPQIDSMYFSPTPPCKHWLLDRFWLVASITPLHPRAKPDQSTGGGRTGWRRQMPDAGTLSHWRETLAGGVARTMMVTIDNATPFRLKLTGQVAIPHTPLCGIASL